LLDGETEIKLYGKYYPVKAQIKNIEGLSSHADQKGLLLWLSDLTNKPERIFLVHGETSSLKGLKESIKQNYHWNAEIPSLNQTIKI
ncbi:MAG: fold metallo-hydrolase, partial [Bacteroidetes bacterium]|nr:fold metallo-hydrolase [Bacteroidota bacterium]